MLHFGGEGRLFSTAFCDTSVGKRVDLFLLVKIAFLPIPFLLVSKVLDQILISTWIDPYFKSPVRDRLPVHHPVVSGIRWKE